MTPPKFCEQCGAPLRPTTRFCGNCGTQVEPLAAPPAAPPPAPPSPPTPSAPPVPTPPPPVQEPVATAPEPDTEPVIGVIPGLTRTKGLMQIETFCLVVTPARLVFSLITQAMINAAVQQARADAKARGEGILGQVGAQMAYLDILVERYQTIPVEETLAEQPGNFFIPNAQIKKAEIKPVDARREEVGHYLIIEARSGKYQFTLGGVHPRDVRELLQEALGSVAK